MSEHQDWPANAVQAQTLQEERLRLHALAWPSAVAASAALALTLGVVQSRVIAVGAIASWLSILALALFARALIGRAHRRATVTPGNTGTWLWRYRLSFLAHGVAWGLASWMLFPPVDLAQQTFLLFVLTGLCISSLIVNSFDLRAAMLFCAPTLIALIAPLFELGREISIAMALLVLLFLGFARMAALRVQRVARENTALRNLQLLRTDAIARSHQRLRRAEMLAHVGSFDWNVVSGELEWSDEHFRLWGLEPGSAIPTPELFRAAILPEHRERQHQLSQAALRGEAEYDCKYQICRPDGSVHDIHGRSQVSFDSAGRALRVVGTVQDITRTEQAKDALRTFEFAMNSVNDLVSVLDRDGVFRLVNDSWCRFTGVARAQAVGRSIRDVLPAAVTPKAVLAFQASVEQRESRVLRSKVDVPGAGWRFLETTIAPYVTAGSGVLGVVAVTRDVSEQEKSRVALATSLENLRRTFDVTSDGMFAYDANDPSGRLLFANGRFFATWGIVANQASAISRADVIDAARKLFVDPDREVRRIDEILASQLPHEDRLVLNDGRVLQRRFVPMRDEVGQTAVWSFRDVTREEHALEALRVSDNQQRALMDAFPGYIGVVNEDFVYTYINARFAALLGKPVDQVVGRHVRDVLGQERVGEVSENVGRASQSGRTISEPSYPATAERPKIDLQVTHVKGSDVNGAANYYAFGVDITDRKRAEEAVLLAKDEAERANAAKSAFLASVSHELKTPLNAILGFSQLLRSDPQMSQPSSDNAGEIERAGQHLLSLVNDLIDLGQVEAGHLELSMSRVAVEGVINNSLSLVAPLAAKQGIRIVYAAGDARNAMVQADPVRLRQVIINLLSNAIKYNRSDGAVRVTCQRRISRGDRTVDLVRISVMDTGFGIAPDRAARIFSAFDRLGAERGAVEGTGIGLVITKRLVDAMGGAIGYESQSGAGSTFWVDLVQSTAAPAAARRPATSVPRVVSPALAERRPCILVAEDYAPNQAVLKLQLSSLGCEVEVVNDGAAALARWSAGSFDLLLSDLDMPLMDGLELARTVRLRERSRGGHMPIIALSAAVLGGERLRCAEAGIDDMLAKPISIDGLAAMLSRWLGAAVRGAAPLAPVANASGAVTTRAVLDLDQLYRVLGRVSTENARVLVATFIGAARAGLHELAARSGDPAAVVREMHRQYSSALTVGALRYAELARGVEQEMRANPKAETAQRLRKLAAALARVEREAAMLDTVEPASAPAPLLPDAPEGPLCNSVLVVDDDPVIVLQMQQMLAGIGVAQVLSARNGVEAITLMNRLTARVEVVVCDLNMPEMDGVEMIRRFGQIGFRGGLILMSGADEQLLTTVSKLAELQGLAVLGQIQKPATPAAMRELLQQGSAVPVARPPVWTGSVMTPDTIRAAIAANEFSVWFQPKVDAVTLEPVGVEALARWMQADGSYVPPDLFIAVAERAGIIDVLSGVLVSKALQEGARLHAAGFPLTVSVNVSALWLDDLSLPELMVRSAKSVNLTPSDIIIEVTETGVTKDLAIALDVLTRLRLKGFGLSIDDFGIGYSSFEQLGRFPFTEMKLDRSFVNRGTQDSAARAILESSMAMAQKLELVTVAEGVETETELQLMRELGCANVQGYLIAKPMPADELIQWLGAQREKQASGASLARVNAAWQPPLRAPVR